MLRQSPPEQEHCESATCCYLLVIHKPRLHKKVAEALTLYTGWPVTCKEHREWTDVKHVHSLISLPKKAFKSFCTWMLLPTVLYTPSCVTPGKRREREREVKKKKGECHMDKYRAVEIYRMSFQSVHDTTWRYRCSFLIVNTSFNYLVWDGTVFHVWIMSPISCLWIMGLIIEFHSCKMNHPTGETNCDCGCTRLHLTLT